MRFEDIILDKTKSYCIVPLVSDERVDFIDQLLYDIRKFARQTEHPVEQFPENHCDPKTCAEIVASIKIPCVLVSLSPIVISDFKQGQVLLLHDTEKGRNLVHPDFQTFGSSTEFIASAIFKQKDSFGKVARQYLDSLKGRLREGENANDLIQEAYHNLGESAERVYFIAEAMKSKKK